MRLMMSESARGLTLALAKSDGAIGLALGRIEDPVGNA